MAAHVFLRRSGVPKPRYKPRRFRLCAEKARSWQETAAFTTVGTFFRSRFPAGSRLILHRTPRRLRLMHAFVKRSPPFQAVLLDKSVHYRRKAEARRFFGDTGRLTFENGSPIETLSNSAISRDATAPCGGRAFRRTGGFGRRKRLFLAANLGIRRTAKIPGPRMTPGSDLALRSPERAHVNIGSNSELGDPAHSRPDAHAHPPAQRRSSIPKP